MKLQHLGTEYGGWMIDFDRVPEEGVVIDAGVGTDMSFADALHEVRPQLKFVAIDPTDESAQFVKRMARPWYSFLQAAVIPCGVGRVEIYRSSNPNGGSESCLAAHTRVNRLNKYEVGAIGMRELVALFQPVLIKLDIEGMEYAVVSECHGAKQVAVEFHHRMMSGFSEEDTRRAIAAFEVAGFDVAHKTSSDEYLFVKREKSC